MMGETMKEQGSLSINSENLFPIIKKWLYSDHDIFVRELVSNGCDAITKLKKLEMMGEATIAEDEKLKVEVIVNAEDKTMIVRDNGIGMTADEVKEYITQIAFSGATDFLEKYKDKTNEDQIIGHFGLGFYSAFMVADKVTIDTLSYQNGAKAVHWESEGGTEFEMTDGCKETIGTTITLYLNEESTEFANEFRAREVLDKYCAFMPVEIYLSDETAAPVFDTVAKEELTEKIYNKEVITLAAEEEDRIVGLCIVVIKHRSGMVNMKTAYVDDLVVDQSYQRRGIARSLFQEAEERAKALGAERMDLTVWSFNENALKFYQSIGMVPQRYILEKPLR